jgi:hypothetical protein
MIRMIACELNTNECTVHKIVTQDLNEKKIVCKAGSIEFDWRSERALKLSVGRNSLTA